MVRDKTKKDKIVEAHPIVSMLSEIEIMGEKHCVPIGGFCIDGFYLKSPYILVKEEQKGLSGDNITYYGFVKSSKKMGEIEKHIRKRKRDDKNWHKNRKKELKEELEKLNDANSNDGEVKE